MYQVLHKRRVNLSVINGRLLSRAATAWASAGIWLR
jgi:hypothetical protein